jgi:hypothetical protein
VTLAVTSSSLNVRGGPSTAQAPVARVKKGDRLLLVGQEGEWYQVRLPDGRAGWVHGKYVRPEEPCPPDKPTAEILSGPDEVLKPSAGLGRVVLEGTVSPQGTVVSVRLVANETGNPESARQAEQELRALRFSPPVRKCRPVSFIYVYTRNF